MLWIKLAKTLARPLPALTLLIFAATSCAYAQTPWVSTDPVADLISKLPFFRTALEQDQPGLTNPAAPLVQPPLVRAEFRFRVLYTSMTEGQLRVPDLGVTARFKGDLGIPNNLFMSESMVRAQIARFSLRVHYEGYFSTFSGALAYFQWPEFRIGGDVDLIERNGLRCGLNVDMCTDRPSLSFNLPWLGVSDFQRLNRPVTMGVHAAWNPFGWGGLSSSFEVRCRWPMQQDVRLSEYEIAAGAKGPTTVLGTTGLRAGWRYTIMDIASPGIESHVKWSAGFAEVFCYF